MQQDLYDKTSAESIYEYSLQLFGNSLAKVVQLPEDVENSKNRGDLGSLVEKYFFKHNPPNDHEPDFKEAGVELKTTGVVKKKDGNFKTKERLVLTMIDFMTLGNQKWETSAFLHKCKKMLILFYEYDKNISASNRKFVVKPLMYEIPASDLSVIKSDWEKIRQKVLDGKAHEISEGDTFYLGACRKGAGGTKEALRTQPYSEIKAKGRAFSLKQGYLDKLIASQEVSDGNFDLSAENTFEDITQSRFAKYLGKSVVEIAAEFGISKASKDFKNFKRVLSMRILSKGETEVPELAKAGILLKTVSLNANGKARESMSFPAFDFIKILNTDWEDSTFYEQTERKFLFVVFKIDAEGIERLYKVKYWNMPYEDRLEAKRVWEETKKRVSIDATDLPKISDSDIAHVRPKAKNGDDKALTPQGKMHLKQCFWLNSRYITKIISEL